MPRKKSNKFIECFKIFFSSIKTYFMYFDECIKALAFPIFGQLLSIILIFTAVYYFSMNVEKIRNIGAFFDNDTNLLILLSIIILPLLIVLVKAIYDYIIAFSSLNILFYTASKKKKAKNIDLNANNNVIKRKLFQYILLMLLVTLILIVPPLIFVAPIVWIFLCLSFQVFAFEGEIGATQAISRSIELVKGNVIVTIIMLLLCYFVTYSFLPNMFIWFADKINFSFSLVNLWEDFFALLPIESWNNALSSLPLGLSIDAVTISKYAVESSIAFVIIGFTLPFRCCCFTELYRLYDSDKIKEISKSSEDIISRATKKGKN